MGAAVAWRENSGGQLEPALTDSAHAGKRVAWAAFPGSQEAFLECPVTEALIEGTRGGGKSDLLLMDYAQHVGRGYGEHWRGILFRKTFPELENLIAASERWFRDIFPAASYNRTEHLWRFPAGETLRFAFMERESDYWRYHGKQFAWIGWDELTTWPDAKPYKAMFSCLRSPVRGIPLKVRATTNPAGRGHNWVKARFRLPVAPGRVVGPIVRTEGEPDRVAIHSSFRENLVLLHAQPNYEENLVASAPSPHVLKAWKDGSWDIVAGGMFDDVWNPSVHIVPSFRAELVPTSWRIDRSYDHGQSKPFSVGWWAQSNGELPDSLAWLEALPGRPGTVARDLIRIDELYGWSGTENEGVRMAARDIARDILRKEHALGLKGRVRPGPADSAIWTSDEADPKRSVAGDMEAMGVRWDRADKKPGSRKNGWEQVRDRLKAAVPPPKGKREAPGLFVLERCAQFLRTFVTLPRDERDPDDVDTDSEDHIADEVRYRCRFSPTGAVVTRGGHIH